MSRLEELIEDFCPDGVEYKTIGDVCDKITDYVAAGSFADLSKNVIYSSKPDFAQLVRTTDLKSNFSKDNFVYVSEAAFNYLWRVNLNEESIIMPNIGNCGEVYYVLPNQLPYENNVLGPNAILVRSSSCDNKFLSYLLQTKEFQFQLNKITSPTGQTKFNKTELKKLLIPLPPLPVQHEIVRILDNFTELTAELTVELTARKKQYEYYRDELFAVTNNAPRKMLGEIAIDMYRGSGIKRDQVTEKGTPCVRYGEIYTTYNIWFDTCVSYTNAKEIQNKKYFEHGDILFAITGESVSEIGKCCVYVGHEKCLAGGDIVVMKHNENPKYIAYALSTTDAQIQKSKGKVKSKVVHSSVPALKAIEIPIPPKEEQARIVAILDRFDSLVNDIAYGLPAEIEARRKQYEYYRDKLLNFKEASA